MSKSLTETLDPARNDSAFLWTFLLAVPAIYGLLCLALWFLVLQGNAHRIYDLREFNPKVFSLPDLAGAYLSAKVRPESTVFIGSSFTFGYPFRTESSMPYLVERVSGQPAVNASLIGASLTGLERFFLCELGRRELRARNIVVEIPAVNEATQMQRTLPKNRMRQGECVDGTPRGLLWAIATRPAMTWFAKLRDGYQLEDQTSPIQPIDKGYLVSAQFFDEIKATLAARIRQALATAGRYGRVFAFVSPVSLDRIAKGGQDATEIRRQLSLAEADCVSALGPRCIPTMGISQTPELFYNATHLNEAGNRTLAKLVSERLAR